MKKVKDEDRHWESRFLASLGMKDRASGEWEDAFSGRGRRITPSTSLRAGSKFSKKAKFKRHPNHLDTRSLGYVRRGLTPLEMTGNIKGWSTFEFAFAGAKSWNKRRGMRGR